jgi:hypothetical protein
MQSRWLRSVSVLSLAALTAVGCAADRAASPTRATAAAVVSESDGGVTAQGGVEKVTICHIPPGNPENAHTITVGAPAVPAHLENHGDSIGECVRPSPSPSPIILPSPE